MPDTFGKRLRQARKAAGLTLEALAVKTNCTRSLLAQYERGLVAECKMLLLFAIADALRVAPRWLATGEGSQDATGPVLPEERELLVCYRHLAPEIRQGFLRSMEAVVTATGEKGSVVNPFAGTKPLKG